MDRSCCRSAEFFAASIFCVFCTFLLFADDADADADADDDNDGDEESKEDFWGGGADAEGLFTDNFSCCRFCDTDDDEG